jgi:hypothetical protein
MVQIIPANPRNKSFGEALGKGLGAGLQALGEGYAKKKNEEKQERQLQEENEALRQQGIELGGIRNPKLREKGFELGFKQKNKAAEQAEKLKGEQETQKQLVSFADRLESENPKLKGIADIYRLEGIPLDQKTKIVQSITGTDIYREDQQKRLMLDSTLKRYNSRLKELDSEIQNVKNPNSTGREEANNLRKQRMALRNERDQLLDFRALNGMEEEWDEDEEDFEIEDEAEDDVEAEEAPKVRFDPNNNKHRATAEKLYKKYKDKEKVRKILQRNFKL